METDNLSPSQPQAGKSLFVSRWKLLSAALGLLLVGLFVVHALRPALHSPPGPIQSWTPLETKEALAQSLRKSVKLEDFKVEAVKVSKGQNYWGLAREAGMSIDDLIGYNLDMQHLNAYIGRALLLGSPSGTLHQVQKGESAASIEADYGVEAGSLAKANHWGLFGLREGQVLFIPKAAPRQLTPEMAELFANRRFFRSPLAGKYTSLLGVRTDPFTGDFRTHNGVDIKAPFNALVAAAADGKVIEAGWKGGYGKSIVIDHADGYRTLYGHLNVILVKSGQTVQQHQFIGKVGKTGRTTGAHLHFTIWKHGKLRDPLKYLW